MKFALLCCAALVSVSFAADCKVFYEGQCPGAADCMCTHNAGCSADGTCARNATIAKDTACAGSCRKVLHGSVKYTFLLPLPHYLSLTLTRQSLITTIFSFFSNSVPVRRLASTMLEPVGLLRRLRRLVHHHAVMLPLHGRKRGLRIGFRTANATVTAVGNVPTVVHTAVIALVMSRMLWKVLLVGTLELCANTQPLFRPVSCSRQT